MFSFLGNLELFDNSTQSLGRAYFKQGLVKRLLISGGEVDAEVLGNEDYHVHLSFDGNNKLIKGSCTCPCQFPCEHQIAVLYQLEDQDNPQNLLSTTLSATDLANQMKAASRNRDYRHLYQIGLTILAKMGSFSPKESAILVSFFFANFGSFAYANKFNWSDLIRKQLLTLPISNQEKTQLLYDLLTNRQVNSIAQSSLLYAFADWEKTAPLYDGAFVHLYQENPLLAKNYLSSDLYHPWNCAFLSDAMFLVLLQEDCYLSSQVDVASRLPKLGLASTPEEIDLYLGIIEYLLKKHRVDEVPKDALSTLQALGQKEKTEQLACDLFKENGSFASYLAYRPFIPQGKLEETLSSFQASLLDGCKDAILLYESPLPGLSSPNLSNISYVDFWLCRDHISPQKRADVVEVLNKKLSASLEARRVNGDCAYGLLLLDHMGAKDVLLPFLSSERVAEMSLEDPFLRGVYLHLLSHLGLLNEKGFYRYGGLDHVSQ